LGKKIIIDLKHRKKFFKKKKRNIKKINMLCTFDKEYNILKKVRKKTKKYYLNYDNTNSLNKLISNYSKSEISFFLKENIKIK